MALETEQVSPVGIEDKLQSLTLNTSDFMINHVKAALKDILSSNPQLSTAEEEKVRELNWWDCFAEVYSKEVEQQKKETGCDATLDMKRQILADILVWAEITQEHYDKQTRSYVSGMHADDASFQRIGKVFLEVKHQRGL